MLNNDRQVKAGQPSKGQAEAPESDFGYLALRQENGLHKLVVRRQYSIASSRAVDFPSTVQQTPIYSPVRQSNDASTGGEKSRDNQAMVSKPG